jgi:hypothetical protein
MACLGLILVQTGRAQQPVPFETRLDAARQAYDATNYEQVRDVLDVLIPDIGSPSDASGRQLLASAYELRGRARLNLRDTDGARSDFRSLLLVTPAFVLPAQAGPRAQVLFDEVRAATVGEVVITVTPADAVVTLDGVPVTERPATVILAAGSHTIAATRRGHRAVGQTFTVMPGVPSQPVALVLERDSSSLTFTTSPPNVEVLINGVSRGFTEPDPSRTTVGDARAGLSKPFLVEELPNGRHRIEFRRTCFISAERSLELDRPDEVKLDIVGLAPAVASVAVSANVPNATVFLDETPRGAAPQVLSDICQGPHVIEVRTPTGRHLRRFDLKPGQKETFAANVRPAYAIVSDSGANSGVRGAPDLRLMAETAFQGTRTLTLFATAEKRTAELVARDSLPQDWLAFDAQGRPVGAASQVGEMARRELSERLTRAFDAQGIAVVAREPTGDRSDMLLILLAPGSARPDVVRWKVDNPASVRQAVARIDEVPPVTRTSIGLLAVDVLDVNGAVVASLAPGSRASTAGVQTGDVVTAAGGKAVTGAAALAAIVNGHPTGQALTVDIRDRADKPRTLEIDVQRVPRLVELLDQTVLSNVLLTHYAARAASRPEPLEEVALRLNSAGAFMRLEMWNDARRELETVRRLAAEHSFAAPVAQSITSTTQYLLGFCLEALGDAAGAEKAWTESARAPGVLLTDSGDPLKELSERRLTELRQGKGQAR